MFKRFCPGELHVPNMGSSMQQFWPADLKPERSYCDGPFANGNRELGIPLVVGCDDDAALRHCYDVRQQNLEHIHRHTNFFVCNGFARLDPRVQMVVPARELDNEEQTACRVLCLNLLGAPELRVEASLISEPPLFPLYEEPPREVRFRIIFLDKLKKVELPPSAPIEISVMVVQTEKWDAQQKVIRDARFHIRSGPANVDVTDWVTWLAAHQARRDIYLAEAYTGKHTKTAKEAITAINRQVCRNITAEEKLALQKKIADTEPVHPSFFKLPPEVRELIWHFALNPRSRSLYIRPYRQRAQACCPPPSQRPSAAPLLNDHMLLGRAHAAEVRTHLYGTRIWQFGAPAHLHRFLARAAPATLRQIRRIELHFEPLAWVAFLRPALPATLAPAVGAHDLFTPMYAVDAFLASLAAAHHPRLELTARFPRRRDMPVQRCHLALSAWIVKAFDGAARAHPRLRARLRFASDLADECASACKRQMRREMRAVDALRVNLDNSPWEDLRGPLERGRVPEGLPLCAHPGGHPCRVGRGGKPPKKPAASRVERWPRVGEVRAWPLDKTTGEEQEQRQSGWGEGKEVPSTEGDDGASYSSASEDSEPDVEFW